MGDGLPRGAAAEHLSAPRPRYRTGSRLPSVAGTTAAKPAIRHLCEHRFLPPTIMLCAQVSPSQNPFARRRNFSGNSPRNLLLYRRLQCHEIFAALDSFACRKVASIGRVPRAFFAARSAAFPQSEAFVPGVNLGRRKPGLFRPSYRAVAIESCRGRAGSAPDETGRKRPPRANRFGRPCTSDNHAAVPVQQIAIDRATPPLRGPHGCTSRECAAPVRASRWHARRRRSSPPAPVRKCPGSGSLRE